MEKTITEWADRVIREMKQYKFGPTPEQVERVKEFIRKSDTRYIDVEIMQPLPQPSPWIRVADRLPDGIEKVYVSSHERGEGGQVEAQLLSGEWYSSTAGAGVKLRFTPTHWLPKTFIPAPPKD